jgi:starch synthase
VVLGSGEPALEAAFRALQERHPRQVAFRTGYDEALAHRIEAGADVFLMPSRFEPCGLNQMYSLKYGTVPVVRRTGGLADTVAPFDAATGRGTGFLFDAFTPEALADAIRRAIAVWRVPDAWERVMRNGMAEDFSWARQGREYERLYEALVAAPQRP